MENTPRRSFLKNVGYYAASIIASSFLVTSCSKKENNPSTKHNSASTEDSLEVIVGRDVQAVSRDPSDYKPIDWAMIPGGSLESLSSPQKYYMKISSKNGINPKRSLGTIITSGNLALVMVSVYENESTNNVSYHIDTNSYTDYLTSANRDSAKKGIDVYFSFSDEKSFDYHAHLPTFTEMGPGAFKLTLEKCQPLKLSDYEVASKAFYIPGKIPAIARIQGNEKTIYMLHQKKANK